MEIKTSDKFCIITPLAQNLSGIWVKKLLEEILANRKFKIGLDMSYVNECDIDFIDMLTQIGNIGLFNVASDVFALFSIMNIDKKVELFVSEMDFKADKHQLLNRKFCIV